MNKRRSVKCVLALVLSLLLLCCSACEVPYVNWVIGKDVIIRVADEVMEEEEVRILALQYKGEFDNYYQQLLGNDYWNVSVSEDLSFEDYVKEYYIFEECQALLVLSLIAKDHNIRLSREEQDDIRVRATEYYNHLSADEIRFTGAKESHVRSVMTRYRLAEKTIEYLTKDARTEVNDEESRVADIQVIHVRSEALAEEALQRIENGESFLSVAKSTTVDPVINYSVERGQMIRELEQAVFSLSAGENSDVIRVQDEYYLIHIAEYYDTLLSRNLKRNMLAERRFEAWQSIYQEYLDIVSVSRNELLYKGIEMNVDGEFPFIDLFKM